jgi:hypothetical protein
MGTKGKGRKGKGQKGHGGKPAGGHYLTPGVYIEEVPAASKPIEAVGTAVAAFVGLSPLNPLRLARTVALVALVAALVRKSR